MEKLGLEGSIKELKDYTLIEVKLYKRLPREGSYPDVSMRYKNYISKSLGFQKKLPYTEGCSAWGITGQI